MAARARAHASREGWKFLDKGESGIGFPPKPPKTPLLGIDFLGVLGPGQFRPQIWGLLIQNWARRAANSIWPKVLNWGFLGRFGAFLPKWPKMGFAYTFFFGDACAMCFSHKIPYARSNGKYSS